MSHKVVFVEKNGQQGSISLPTLAAATTYARTVKNGAVLPGGTDDSFSITKCGSRAEEEAKRIRERLAQQSERQDEAYMEEGVQARLQGASTSEALDRASEATAQVVQECGGCGKRIAPGQTTCYTCRRYS